MAIGPSENQEQIKETPFSKTRAVVSSVLKSVYQDPAERLFYFGIALLLVGLPAGLTFPFAYYGVVYLLGVILLSRAFLKFMGEKEKHAD